MSIVIYLGYLFVVYLYLFIIFIYLFIVIYLLFIWVIIGSPIRLHLERYVVKPCILDPILPGVY